MGANCSFLPSLSQNAIATIATRSWFRSLDQNLSSPVQPFWFDVSAENIAPQLTENMTLLETQGRTSKVWPGTTTKTKSARCRRKSSISQLTAESSHLVMVNYSILLVIGPSPNRSSHLPYTFQKVQCPQCGPALASFS